MTPEKDEMLSCKSLELIDDFNYYLEHLVNKAELSPSCEAANCSAAEEFTGV
jgi:hypothetical protein